MKKRDKNRAFKLVVFILCLIIVYSIASIGSIFTSSGVNTSWYDSIKPEITPPNLVFPIVWNILFLLISISLFLLIINTKKNKTFLLVLFSLNLFFNVLWSYLYFSLRNIHLAFFDLILLLITSLFIAFYSRKVDKRISYLFLPYIIWLIFAGVLNYLSILKI
jgi:tryptophan-rich sensory protein